MMRTGTITSGKILLILLFGWLCSATATAQNAEQQEIIDDAERAKQTLIAKDAGLADLFDKSEGYVIFPNVGKGAYIVGGASGNGAVYQDGQLIGMADLKQLDVGLQIGGKAFIEVVFFGNESAIEEFKAGGFKLSGNASAVALDKGASETIRFDKGIAVVTLPKAGAMLEVSVGGQRFEYEGF